MNCPRFSGAAAALLLLATTGCGSEAPAPAPSPASDAGPEAPPGIALSEARVQLPVVAGRPGVAYFTVRQNGGTSRAIAAVRVAGADRAEMHTMHEVDGISRMQTVAAVPLAPDATVAFAPGGTHVMLFDLAPSLKPGTTTELTVTFDNGDKASTSAAVTAVGAADPAR